jgi:UDP-N-acetylmuramyl pentapeptide phosphotransferase/UDP-N-acetylglucosamine-1-phosphate transferase
MAKGTDTQRYAMPTLLGALLLAMSAVVGGVVGVVMALVMMYASKKAWLVDSSEKHGISESNSSRFGGLFVFIGAIAFSVSHRMFSESSFENSNLDFSQYLRGYEWVAILAAALGFWEDYTKRLSAKFRLQFLFLLIAAYFVSDASALPINVVPSNFPVIFNHPALIGLGVTIFVVGFINAGNIADGANGLLSCIAMAVFLIAFLETGALIYFALLVSISVFVIFNMSTGLMFLGDFGSYGLSALMALVCVDLYSQGHANFWFYACLLGYPSVELVRVMLMRWRDGVSPMFADNNHLHNHVFIKFKMLGLPPLVANSFTGLSLSLLSTSLPLTSYLFGLMPINSASWGYIFIVYCLIHVSLFSIAAKSKQ